MNPAAASVRLRILQFNTLGKHLAETLQFPYTVDVAAEALRLPERGGRYDSWEAYGIGDGHWLRPGLPLGSTPTTYLLGTTSSASVGDSTGGDSVTESEGGTMLVEESGGMLIMSWAQRFPQLVAQIKQHDPDVIFLQVWGALMR